MTPPAAPARYKNHRFPGEIIRPGVCLSERFPWSSRDVPALLWARGIDGTQDARRPWGLQGGQDDAKQLKQRRAPPGEKWPLAAVFLTMNGERHALGRAVAPEDNVLALLGQSRRNTQAAKKGFRTLLQGLPYGPRVIITAKLKRYGAAKRERLPGAVRTNCLSPSPEECASPAQDLILQVNGGHIPMQEKDKRSFEALAAIVYRPEKIQAVD